MLMVEEELWSCHIWAKEPFIFLMRKFCEILYGRSAEGYECAYVCTKRSVRSMCRFLPLSACACVCACKTKAVNVPMCE